MKGRFLLVGTITGGITLFLWRAISHMAIPWPEVTFREILAGLVLGALKKKMIPEGGAA